MTPLACANCCGLFVPREVESRRVGDALDVGFVTGEEVPAAFAARAGVAIEIRRLLGGRHHRGLARIEADGHHVEVGADGLVEHADPAHQAVQDLVTEHRAFVVDERHHDRARAEVVAELHRGALFVAEHGVERQGGVELLLEAHVLQRRRHRARGGTRRGPQARRVGLGAHRDGADRPAAHGHESRHGDGREGEGVSSGDGHDVLGYLGAEVRPADESCTIIGGAAEPPGRHGEAALQRERHRLFDRDVHDAAWPDPPSRSCAGRRAARP